MRNFFRQSESLDVEFGSDEYNSEDEEDFPDCVGEGTLVIRLSRDCIFVLHTKILVSIVLEWNNGENQTVHYHG